MLDNPKKCPSSHPFMFFLITNFIIDEKDYLSNILITVIDSMGKPEHTKTFDQKTNYDNKKWIQDGH